MAAKKLFLLLALTAGFATASSFLNVVGIYLLNFVGLYSVAFDPPALLGAAIAGALIGIATFAQCES